MEPVRRPSTTGSTRWDERERGKTAMDGKKDKMERPVGTLDDLYHLTGHRLAYWVIEKSRKEWERERRRASRLCRT